MSDVIIPRSEYNRLVRESERRQAAIAYVKAKTYVDKDILLTILGANEEESEG